MSEPEVTIVVPAWGSYAGEPLQEALASLQAQDTPARIVVVDNASDPPLSAPEGVEVIRSPERLTVGAARNLGLECVGTPYVLFWDADDLMLSSTLGFLLREIVADERLVAVAAGIVDDETGVRHRWPPRWSARLTAFPRVFAVCHSIWSLFPSTGATLMSTPAVRAGGGYAASERAVSAEDWVLGVSLAFRGRIRLVERPGRLYRRLGASLLEEHGMPANQLDHAREVRHRLRTDPALPDWARRSAGALEVLHPLVLLGMAPLARRIRGAARRLG